MHSSLKYKSCNSFLFEFESQNCDPIKMEDEDVSSNEDGEVSIIGTSGQHSRPENERKLLIDYDAVLVRCYSIFIEDYTLIISLL